MDFGRGAVMMGPYVKFRAYMGQRFSRINGSKRAIPWGPHETFLILDVPYELTETSVLLASRLSWDSCGMQVELNQQTCFEMAHMSTL